MIFPELGRWVSVKQTDPRVVDLYRRHYSRRKGDGAHGVAGAGETLTLLHVTESGNAVYIWRTEHWLGDGEHEFIGKPDAIACSIFRNESSVLSSDLVREADALADVLWPDRWRHYTWVDPRAIRSGNPGLCFQKAGWRKTGLKSKDGKVMLARDQRRGMEVAA